MRTQLVDSLFADLPQVVRFLRVYIVVLIIVMNNNKELWWFNEDGFAWLFLDKMIKNTNPVNEDIFWKTCIWIDYFQASIQHFTTTQFIS